MSDNFHCLPLAGVASNQVVVVGFHYVAPQLIIMGDIDLSSMDHQSIPLLQFVSAQSSFGAKFFQCLDDRVILVSAVVNPIQEISLFAFQCDTQGTGSICCQRFAFG